MKFNESQCKFNAKSLNCNKVNEKSMTLYGNQCEFNAKSLNINAKSLLFIVS